MSKFNGRMFRCCVPVRDGLQFRGASVATHPCSALVFEADALEHLQDHGLQAGIVGMHLAEVAEPPRRQTDGGRCECGGTKAFGQATCTACKVEDRRRRGWRRRWESLQGQSAARFDGRKYASVYNKERRAAARAAGLCGYCCKRPPRDEHVKQCDECLGQQSAAHKRARERRRTA